MQGNGLITLLTDFGLSDPYVGVMKGAIASIDPALRVIDLTHEIPPQKIVAARFALASAIAYFPPGTVHVVVVDPGVGSRRRAIAIACKGAFFVGPDNGVFDGILDRADPAIAAVELTDSNYWRTPNPSTTFHGRDIFAPVGAHLARGVPFSDLGEAIAPETLVRSDFPDCQIGPTQVSGCIQYVDRFGNLISNIPGDAVGERSWVLSFDDRQIPSGQTYADVGSNEAIALVGSHGWVELAVNGGNARDRFGLDVGARVDVILDFRF
jgi:S-adenosylmethionine hydrolase